MPRPQPIVVPSPGLRSRSMSQMKSGNVTIDPKVVMDVANLIDVFFKEPHREKQAILGAQETLEKAGIDTSSDSPYNYDFIKGLYQSKKLPEFLTNISSAYQDKEDYNQMISGLGQLTKTTETPLSTLPSGSGLYMERQDPAYDESAIRELQSTAPVASKMTPAEQIKLALQKVGAISDQKWDETPEGYEKKLQMEQKYGKGAKIPIQSDKIQVAMAELGIDPADPNAYTPENISKAGARLRKIELEERLARNEQITAVQRASIEHSLRGELRQDKYVQDFKDVDNKYQVMERAITKAGNKPESYVAVDQALITLYNKMTDPTSVVRESEYARTPENMSIANNILGKLDKWRQGGAGLTDVERNALIEMAREFHRGYAVNYDQIVSDFEQTAKKAGVDPMAIGIPYRRKSTTKGSEPNNLSNMSTEDLMKELNK